MASGLNESHREQRPGPSRNATVDYVKPLLLECVPTWLPSKTAWGWGWQIHTYGLSLCYFALGIFSCVVLLVIHRRWKVYRFLIFSLLMLLTIGLLRGLYFLIDPYGYKGKLSPTVNRLLFQVSNPALSGAFGAVQRLILRLTKLDVGSNRLQKTSFVAAVVFLHFVVTVLVETVVSENHRAKPLLLLSHGYFIVWTTFLSVTFIYNGFKLTHYTSETQRALKELNTYSQIKKSCEATGAGGKMTRSSTQQRLMKPRIKITNEENKTCSIVSDSELSTDSEIEDTRSFSSTSKGDSDMDAVKAGRSDRTMPRPVASSTVRGHDRIANDDRAAYDGEGYSETSSDFSEMDQPGGMCAIKRRSSRILRAFRKSPTFGESEEMLVNKSSGCAGHSMAASGKTTTKVRCEARKRPVSAASRVCPNGYCADLQTGTPDDHSACENGYMADTESSFTKRCPGRFHKRLSSCCTSRDSEPSLSAPVIMATSPSTLSLHRIRQSRMIHKVILATYVTTFLGFVVCLLQLYSVFGSYGIFGSNPKPDPWPWLLFQTFQRLTELGMGTSIGVAGCIVIRHRHQRSGFRRCRLQPQDTTCFVT